jgi:hypothetical protein
MTSNRKYDKYKIATIILTLIVISLSCLNVYLNTPYPKLEVGGFPSDSYLLFSNTVTVHVENPNDTSPSNWTSPLESGPYNLFNVTYQVYNCGKGSAYNVDVKGIMEPSNSCKVIATYVYVGEPLPSNLLKVVSDEYKIGLLGSGKSYVFKFEVRLSNFNSTSKFILKITSDNAGTILREISYG